MWIETMHVHIDEQGRKKKQAVTLNMNNVIGYMARGDDRTRLFFELGHDLQDRRSAHWMDVLNPKEEFDQLLDVKQLRATDEA
ncbi:MAG: hypothetical protein ACOCR1_05055 [Planctomycetota bacterium]